MGTKIIFLDIDGVLNSRKWTDLKMSQGQPFSLVEEVDDQAVANLNEIIAKTGAKVVVSSSWRIAFELDYIEGVLRKAGFKGAIIDKTPRRTTYPARRGNEIKEWLLQRDDIVNYVIVDDDSDMLQEQLKNFVHTSFIDGLKKEHVEQAVRILNADQASAQATTGQGNSQTGS